LSSRQHHFNTLQELVFDICSRESADAAGWTAVMLWQIWSSRNDVVILVRPQLQLVDWQ